MNAFSVYTLETASGRRHRPWKTQRRTLGLVPNRQIYTAELPELLGSYAAL